MRVLIIGAGGHAQVVADILLLMHRENAAIRPMGFVDDNPALTGKQFVGLPVLGVVSQMKTIAHDAVIVAIGDNRTRAQFFSSLKKRRERFVNAIHPRAIIASEVSLGEGLMICAGVVVNTGASIGDNVILNTSCSIDHHNNLGPHSHIAPGAHLGGNTRVGAGVFVGIGAAVIPNRAIGEWTTIGAGAVVTRDLPDSVTAVGVPARVIKIHSENV